MSTYKRIVKVFYGRAGEIPSACDKATEWLQETGVTVEFLSTAMCTFEGEVKHAITIIAECLIPDPE
jgi:hypothetical protein